MIKLWITKPCMYTLLYNSNSFFRIWNYLPKSAVVSRHNLCSFVVKLSIVSSTLALVWLDTGVVDSGHSSGTFAAGVWSNFAAFFCVRALGPSASQWAAVGEESVEDERLTAFLCWKRLNVILLLKYWYIYLYIAFACIIFFHWYE